MSLFVAAGIYGVTLLELNNVLQLVIGGLGGLALYFGLAYVLKMEPMELLLKVARDKFSRKE
jgi:hypothetical protein